MYRKKRDARARLLFYQSKPIAFFVVLVAMHSRCLSFLLLILKRTTRKSYFYVNSFILVTGRAEILSSSGTPEGLVSRVEGNAPCFETFIVPFLLP